MWTFTASLICLSDSIASLRENFAHIVVEHVLRHAMVDRDLLFISALLVLRVSLTSCCVDQGWFCTDRSRCTQLHGNSNFVIHA